VPPYAGGGTGTQGGATIAIRKLEPFNLDLFSPLLLSSFPAGI